jgi:peroxiredoxin
VLAVDIDKVSDFVNVTALQARLGLTYPILVDDHFQARSSYQVANVPVTYFIDSQHVIRAIVQEPLDDTSLHKAVDSVERG